MPPNKPKTCERSTVRATKPTNQKAPPSASSLGREKSQLNSQLSPISTCIGYRPTTWSFYPEWTGSRDSFKAEIAKFLQINQTVLVKRIYTKLKNDADGEIHIMDLTGLMT